MNKWVRVTGTSALAFICLGAEAKVADKCIQTLEARPSRAESPTTRPCPVAIGYTPREAGPAGPHPTGRLPYDAQAESPKPAPMRV